MHSSDFTEENIKKLAELFPNCVTESKDDEGNIKKSIDFDLLRPELSNNLVEGPQERYSLNWPGKREALLTANAPIAKTLRPSREESVDFNNSQNLFIEGDNLDALKLMQETYLGKIKMIYIDPPYNTGNDFVYEDDFAENTEEFLKKSNQKDEKGNRLVANTESNGRFHSDWLSMMYPRLKLARNLLKEDGVILISIDDNEVDNLKKVCNEIYGEGNFLNSFVVKRRTKSLNSQFINIQTLNQGFEYVIAYRKSEKFHYSSPYNEASESRKVGYWNSFWNNADRPTMRYDIEGISIKKGQWKWSKERAFRALHNYKEWEKISNDISLLDYWKKENEVYFTKTGNKMEFIMPTKTTVKYWVTPSNVNIMDTNLIEYYVNDDTGRRKYGFDTVKSLELLKKLITMVTKDDSVILDFFAGSATTAHAVMQLNADDGGKRKFIMVQLPEPCDEKSEAFKAGYKTIAEIGKERIRSAGKKIKEENALTAPNLDIGFRVLKVDSSNMQDVYYNPDAYSQDLLSKMADNIKPDRTDEDLLFQVLLDWGVDLSLPISKEKIAGNDVFFVSDNALVACFAKKGEITEDFCKELAKYKPLRVVFRDSGFKDDSMKINVEQIFKLMSLNTEIKTI